MRFSRSSGEFERPTDRAMAIDTEVASKRGLEVEAAHSLDYTLVNSLTVRILGTPNEADWPGVEALPDYKATFPKWSGTPLTSHIRGLDTDGLDLLTSMLIYDPAHRMSGMLIFFHHLPFGTWETRRKCEDGQTDRE